MSASSTTRAMPMMRRMVFNVSPSNMLAVTNLHQWEHLFLTIAFSCPVFATSGAVTIPARSPEAGSVLCFQNVGKHALISHRPRRAPCGGIEDGTGVFRSVCTQAIDLQRQSVVKMSRHGPPDNRYATQCAIHIHTGNGELMPNNRLMMPMMLGDKGVCVFK